MPRDPKLDGMGFRNAGPLCPPAALLPRRLRILGSRYDDIIHTISESWGWEAWRDMVKKQQV